MKRFLIACVIGLLASQAHANRCAPHPAMLDHLAKKYGETRQSVGLAENGALVETFASDETGTWTIAVTAPNGLTCLIAAGQSFERISTKAVADGDPT